MSVMVKIKQKSLLKKKLTIKDIIKISGLSYGVSDENYRLIRNEIADHTLLYNEKSLARGIDLSIDKDDIILLLSLPTTKNEIRCFYEVIEKVCKELKLKKYIRDENTVLLEDNEKYIKSDEEGSIAGLQSLQEMCDENTYSHLEIFGIYNPISIGKKEIKTIKNNLENFEKFLNEIQSLDVYYATPKIYKVEERLIGIYVIPTDVPTVVPTKPYIVLNQIKDIKEWYVILKNEQELRFEDFINNIKNKEYYDQNHVIITISEEEKDKLLAKYQIKI